MKKILFLCGSLNQTTQMHQIARELSEHEQAFAPYYLDGALEVSRRLGLLDFSIAGSKLRRRCLDYLVAQGLPLDLEGRRGPYDLVLSCSDLVVQRNLRGRRMVLVQEGILDPEEWTFRLWRRFPFLPRWLGGTTTTGMSLAYDRFCVASEGYRDHFRSVGVPGEKLVVTGIPNFDDCRRFLDNDFALRGYVLVCTSDGRETFKPDDRAAFLERCLRIAGGRPLVFKLHPNEKRERAIREIRRVAPGAPVFTGGSAEEMIANCEALVTEWSSTVFVGLALGKECHSNFDLAELRRLLPVQNGCAAANVAEVCRRLLAEEPVTASEDGPFPGLALSAATP
jgi:hypothetical protein